ncbi:MAG TPA: hypothetical protein ENJ27_00370 [Candidatus Moranbacteria bacterium]|nr:hypothetical protein [Candidatus Moranbacteria bacterium]
MKNVSIIILTTIILLNSFLWNIKNAKADIWGTNFLAAQAQVAEEEVIKQIQAALVAALKKEAAKMLSDTINNLVSGANQAGSLFITDWEDYLFKSPRNNTNAYMNDFFTVTTRGKSSGNYTSACGSNFSEWRSSDAQDAVNNEVDLSQWQSDFEEFACGYQEMFSDGTWSAYEKSMQPNNNPIAYKLFAESTKNKIQEAEEKKALAQSQAYLGFKAKTDKSGTVITPGSFIESMTAAANKIDMDMIANSHKVGEVAGIVAGKIASNVIKQGIGNARKQAQAKINDGICNASQSLRDGLKGLSPNGNMFESLGIGSLGKSKDSRCNVR